MLLEDIIADFRDRPLPSLTPREARLPALKGKIDTVIGMRRSGKTWFLYQRMQALLDQGIAKDRLLYINFDDERLLPMRRDELSAIPEVYYRLYPHNRSQTCYFFATRSRMWTAGSPSCAACSIARTCNSPSPAPPRGYSAARLPRVCVGERWRRRSFPSVFARRCGFRASR